MFLLGKYPPLPGSVACGVAWRSTFHSQRVIYLFYKRPPYESCGDMHERSYFLSHMAQSFPAFREAGKAMLMIVISQGAWFQTGILPLQLLLNIKCSSFSLSLFLPIFLHSYLPPSATQPTFFFFSFLISLFLFRSRLLLPLECLHWEIVCKGLPSVSTSSSEIFLFLDIYCTLQLPGVLVCTCVFEWVHVCVCVWDHVHIAACMSWEKRKLSRWPTRY